MHTESHPKSHCFVVSIMHTGYFMNTFFFYSGYFVPISYDKKGCCGFLHDRIFRLGVPFVIYTFFLGTFVYGGEKRIIQMCDKRIVPCTTLHNLLGISSLCRYSATLLRGSFLVSCLQSRDNLVSVSFDGIQHCVCCNCYLLWQYLEYKGGMPDTDWIYCDWWNNWASLGHRHALSTGQ